MNVTFCILRSWSGRLRLRERLGFELGGRRPSFAKAWPPKTYPRPSAPVAPRWIGIPLPRGASEGCQVEGGRGHAEATGYRLQAAGGVFSFLVFSHGGKPSKSDLLGEGLGRAGSMTPPEMGVQRLEVQRGGLRRGRPTLAKEDKRKRELSFFMQKEVRLSRFQLESCDRSDSC